MTDRERLKILIRQVDTLTDRVIKSESDIESLTRLAELNSEVSSELMEDLVKLTKLVRCKV